jgi:hypothetical protein
MHRASLNRLVPALLLLAAAGCNNDPVDPDIGTCEAALAKGELVITEIMADPAGADDNSFEWFEIHNPGASEVTLTGVGIEYSKPDGSSAKGHLVKDALTIPAGGYVTVGKATAETLPAYIDYGYGADLSMGNTDGKLKLVCGKVTLDEVLYQDLADGYSRSLGTRPPDAATNDDLGAWCLGADLYNDSEYGSPGAANPDCPLPAPPCGMCYENGELRASRAPEAGQLVISEVMPNAKLTDMSLGEWFELSVVDGEFDLNCLQYGGNTTKFLADPSAPEMTLEAAECIGVRAGDIKLFAEQPTFPGVDFAIDFALVDSPSVQQPDPRHLRRPRRPDPRRVPLHEGHRRRQLEPRPRAPRRRRQRRHRQLVPRRRPLRRGRPRHPRRAEPRVHEPPADGHLPRRRRRAPDRLRRPERAAGHRGLHRPDALRQLARRVDRGVRRRRLRPQRPDLRQDPRGPLRHRRRRRLPARHRRQPRPDRQATTRSSTAASPPPTGSAPRSRSPTTAPRSSSASTTS